MRIPLDIVVDDKEMLVVSNGKVEWKRRPFRPFILEETQGEGIAFEELYERRPITFEKRAFSSLSDMKGYVLNAEGNIFAPTYEDMLAIKGRSFFLGNANESDLVQMSLDIEVLSAGDTFPNADRDQILCIGTQVGNDVRIFGEGERELGEDMERRILQGFSEYLKEINPDIIFTYNGKFFDLPYLYARCARYDIDPYLRRITIVSGEADEQPPPCFGRVHVDLFESVLKDQSLYGIADKKMKTVAETFGLENVIELPPEEIRNTRRVFLENPEKLWEYLRSDVRITDQLADIYLPNHIALAEMVEVPLNWVVEGSSSFIPKITHARELLKRSKIFLSKNIDRYPILEESRFEAAFVDIFQKGRFDKVWKVDFTSMYPSTMITLNLSPETCRLVEFADYSGAQEHTRSGDTIQLRIPDENLEKDVIIHIDDSKDGFIKENLLAFRKMRSELKTQMNETEDDAERQNLKSRQIAIKVLSNTVFGYSGSNFGQFTDLSLAIATVGTCRWLTKQVINWIEE